MSKKDYIQHIEGAERRYINPSMQVRADGDDDTVEGVAAVVGSTTDLGWFEERIDKGAFDDVLKDDTVALFNHDPNLPLARSSAEGDGKLELYLTKEGHLGYRYKTPNTSVGRDLSENIKNGVIKHSSFAFTIGEESWEFASDENGRDKDLRTIKKIDRLYDVSPVTYPAYADTSVAARSKESIEEPNNNECEIREMKHTINKIKNKIKIG